MRLSQSSKAAGKVLLPVLVFLALVAFSSVLAEAVPEQAFPTPTPVGALPEILKEPCEDSDLRVQVEGMYRRAKELHKQQQLAEAIAIIREAIEIAIENCGPEHLTVGILQGKLAHYLMQDFNIREALEHQRATVELFERNFGKGHPRYAQEMYQLGYLIALNGRLYEGLRLTQEAEKLLLRRYPRDSRPLYRLYARQLLIYNLIGDYQKAAELGARIYNSVGKILSASSNTADTAISKTVYALVSVGRSEEALEFAHTRVRDLENRHGIHSRAHVSARNQLAGIFHSLDRTDESIALLEDTLADGRKYLGADYPVTLATYMQLGRILIREGRPQDALDVLKDLPSSPSDWDEQALFYLKGCEALRAIARRDLGIEGPFVEPLEAMLESKREIHWGPEADWERIPLCLASHHHTVGSHAEAHEQVLFTLDLVRKRMVNSFQMLSDHQRVTWLREERNPYDIALTGLALDVNADRDTVDAIWGHMVFRKGFAISLLAGQAQMLRELGDLNLIAVHRTLQEKRITYAQLALQADKDEEFLRALGADITALEQRLAASDVYREDSQDQLLERARAAVPPGGILIDYQKYRRKDLSVTLPRVGWKEWRYGAFMWSRKTGSVFVDLAPAEKIEDALATFANAIRETATDPRKEDLVKSLAASLYRKLLAKLPNVADAETLVVIPDGELALLPFDILKDEEGRWLLESKGISSFSSPRQLARSTTPTRGATTNAAIMAVSEFGEEAGDTVVDRVLSALGLRSVSCNLAAILRGLPPLPGVLDEAKAVEASLRRIPGENPLRLVNERVTEESVATLSRPRVLHIATHGWYLGGCESVDEAPPNPLLMSGLALSGGNLGDLMRNQEGRPASDGLLTALEAAQLDLTGTELVVLSACETGLGESVPGEGIFGLPRAFEHSGVRTTVSSLWQVPDEETGALMDLYYRSLAEGEGKVEALRSAKKALREQIIQEHGQDMPFFWGGFVATGDDSPLPGTRPKGAGDLQ